MNRGSLFRYPHWSAWASPLFLLVVWSIPSLVALNSIWLTAGVEHGYMLVFMASAIAISVIRSGRVSFAHGSPVGALALGMLMLASAVGFAADILIIPQFAWPSLAFAALWAIAGARTAFAFAPSLLMLHFTIPFWQDLQQVFPNFPTLNESLRLATISVSSFWVGVIGIPAFIEEDLISLQWGTFQIAEGCSGRSYFLVAVELALFYGFMFLRQWRTRLSLLGVSMALALVANWIRVFSLILIGYFSQMESPLIADHGTFGWILFLGVLWPLFFVGRKLEVEELRSGEKNPDSMIEGDLAVDTESRRGPSFAVWIVLSLGIALNVILFTPFTSGDTADNPREHSAPAIPGYPAIGEWDDRSRPEFAGASREYAVYVSGVDRQIGLYIAKYERQTQGSELINMQNSPTGLSATADPAISRSDVVINGARIPVSEIRLREETGERLVWSVMSVAGVPVSDSFEAKWRQVLGRLRGRRDASALVISMECAGLCERARQELRDVLESSYPIFTSDI